MLKIEKSIFKTAFRILIVVSLFAILVNFFHPHRIKIAFQRPPLPRATDFVNAEDLPPVSIGNDDKQDGRIVFVTHEQLTNLLDKQQALLIDAREESEFQAGHLPNAINIPYERYFEFEETIKKLPKDKWLVCYCDGSPCDLGELLAEELKLRGFPRIAVYQGGVQDWRKHAQLVKEKGGDDGN